VVRLASVENERLKREINPASIHKMAETLGAAANNPANGQHKLLFGMGPVDLLLVSIGGVFCRLPSFR
jgi:hypothetical protein